MNNKILAALGLILLSISTAFAQADPPARVGRLSDIEGTASFHNGDQDQWSPATINYPVVAGQSYWTEPQTRLELEVGGATFRLDETSLLDILALDDTTTRLELDQGALNLHIASVLPGGVQVLTPLGWVSIGEPGTYHLDAGRPDGDRPVGFLVVTALDGSAEFDGPGSRVAVLAGESTAIGGNPLTAQLSQATTTPIDDWAFERERRALAEETRRFVSPQATGYQDLDAYGRWSEDAGYGPVWYPRDVPADWQPYHYGHWAWLQPWGWTWVDDAPWGFAPFHYGRWVEVGGRWGWCPGERVARPVYAPALVAFIGGAGFVFAVGGASEAAIGWVPLAPDEVYHPPYHVSRDYVRSVNETSVNRMVINKIGVTNRNAATLGHFHNQRAAAVMTAAAFTGAVSVQHATLGVPHDQLLHAHVAADLQHLPPTRAARAGRATPAALTPGSAEHAPPTAPGPKIQPHEHRLGNLPPPPTSAPGHPPPAATMRHDRHDAHAPPVAATPGAGGAAPAATAPTKPHEHRDAHAPPGNPPPAHPAATMNVPPPAKVMPPKPPFLPPVAVVTPPKAPPPPARTAPATTAPKPRPPAPPNAPAHGGPPPKDKDKDKGRKEEPKPNG